MEGGPAGICLATLPRAGTTLCQARGLPLHPQAPCVRPGIASTCGARGHWEAKGLGGFRAAGALEERPVAEREEGVCRSRKWLVRKPGVEGPRGRNWAERAVSKPTGRAPASPRIMQPAPTSGDFQRGPSLLSFAPGCGFSPEPKGWAGGRGELPGRGPSWGLRAGCELCLAGTVYPSRR